MHDVLRAHEVFSLLWLWLSTVPYLVKIQRCESVEDWLFGVYPTHHCFFNPTDCVQYLDKNTLRVYV